MTLNVAGPDVVSLREIAEIGGRLLGSEPRFASTDPQPDLVASIDRMREAVGAPHVGIDEGPAAHRRSDLMPAPVRILHAPADVGGHAAGLAHAERELGMRSDVAVFAATRTATRLTLSSTWRAVRRGDVLQHGHGSPHTRFATTTSSTSTSARA